MLLAPALLVLSTVAVPPPPIDGGDAPVHMCQSLGCAENSLPAHSTSSRPDADARIALLPVGFRAWLAYTSLADETRGIVDRLCGGRLERPPRPIVACHAA